MTSMGRVTDGAVCSEPLGDLSRQAWARVETQGCVSLSPAQRGNLIAALDMYVVAERRLASALPFDRVIEPLMEVAKAARHFHTSVVAIRDAASKPPRMPHDAMIRAIGSDIARARRDLNMSPRIERNTSRQNQAREWENRFYLTLLALQTAASAPQPSLANAAAALRNTLDDLQRSPNRMAGEPLDRSARDSAYRAWRSAVLNGIEDVTLGAWDDPIVERTLWVHLLASEVEFCINCTIHARDRLRCHYGLPSRPSQGHVDALLVRVAPVYRLAGGTVTANKMQHGERFQFSPFIRFVCQLLDELDLEDGLNMPTGHAIHSRVKRLKAKRELQAKAQ
ncbi:MAG: hypothetical protein AB7L90_09110 [Hyphomicrobiaceae bacterium]